MLGIKRAMKYAKPFEEQLARIIRLNDGLSVYAVATNENFEDGVDAFTSFFIQCYHLADWLIKSGYSKNIVYSFIAKSSWLSLCKDLANTQKHQERRGDTFIDFGDFSFGVSTPITRHVDHFNGGQTKFCIDAAQFGPLPLNAMEVANKCIVEWRLFLEIHPYAKLSAGRRKIS